MSAAIVARNAAGVVTGVRRIILTKLVAYDPLKQDLTFNYVNAAMNGDSILTASSIDSKYGEVQMAYANPLPSVVHE